MRLSNFIQRTRALGDLKVPEHDLEAIEALLAEGADLAALLKKRSPDLTPLILLGIWRSSRKQAEHEAFLETIATRRLKEELPAIPSTVLRQTVSRHEVGVLERADALAPAGQFAEHRRRDAIKEALALWNACLAIMRREGRVTIELATKDEALRAELADYVGTITLHEVPAHRWLAIRRGQASGGLVFRYELPMERMLDQVRARGAEFFAVAGGRTEVELLELLVLDDLVTVSLSLKDEEARFQAIRSASLAYLGLLSGARPNQKILAGIYISSPSEKLGVAVINRDGRLLAHGEEFPGENPLATIERLMGDQPVEAVVLPIQASDEAFLRQLSESFGELPVFKVQAHAMGEALRHQTDEIPRVAGMAAVLARRVVRPLKYWGALDPVSLGLAEYQGDLDDEALRVALNEMLVLAQAGVRPADLVRPASTPSTAKAKPPAPAKPLNPMIKTVDDLRPGMEVNGTVTNITQFGAFVSIGLSHEGLIHVSELADHFVSDPNEIVQVGQQLSARVLGVDRGRRRISLSLRAERQPPKRELPEGGGQGASRVLLDDIPGRRAGGPPSRDSGGRGPGPREGFGTGPNPARGANRAQALADLEALFKKK